MNIDDRVSKTADRMEKEVGDTALNKIVDVAKEIANELCPTTETYFMQVVISIMIEATTKAITENADGLYSASEGYEITCKLFKKSLANSLNEKFASTPAKLIAELKKMGAWKDD